MLSPSLSEREGGDVRPADVGVSTKKNTTINCFYYLNHYSYELTTFLLMTGSFAKIILFIGIVVPFFCSCGSGDGDEPETKTVTLAFVRSAYNLLQNGTLQLKIMQITSGAAKGDTTWYNTSANPDGLTWSVADESVASVDARGIAIAKKIGRTKISAKSPDGKLSATTTVLVVKAFSIKPLESKLASNLIFSKGIYLVRNTVIQGFDIDSNGTIFYDQLGGGLPQYIFLVRGEANSAYTDYMQLKYFGHGTNMAVEEDGADRYIWIASNGSKGSDGEYGSSQTISRFEYIPGAIMEKYTDETYYLKNKYNVHPALDVKNDVLAITASGNGDVNRYFYFYKLSAAKALPYTSVTLSSVKFGGEGDGVTEQTEVRTLKVKDLGSLTPLASFSVGPGDSGEKLNYYDFQGFDVADGYVYFYEGAGNDNTGTLPSKAYVTVLDMKGNVIYGRTSVNAISSISELSGLGITTTGYMEPEGIKMKNGTLYCGFASRSTDDKRRANIFRYSMN